MESLIDIYWNTLVIPQPPQTTIIIPPNAGVNINAFVVSINSLENLLSRINLDFAGALCSRLIYKIKIKFRTTKWMHLIEKINQAMLKLLQMKFTPALRKISESTFSSESQLPSRSMLEWFLIKMQGFARLLVRLVITSHQAGEMFRQCLSIGHNWQIIVTLMSLVSQIWTNCQLLLHETFKCYKATHKTMQGSIMNQKPWSAAVLPKDLGLWISEELATLGCDVADIFKISLPKLRLSPNGETSNIVDDASDEETVHIGVTSFQKGFEDLGEIISRDSLIISSVVEHTSPSKDRILDLKNISFDNQESNFQYVNDNIEFGRTVKKKNTKKSKQKKKLLPIIEKNSEENTELSDSSSCLKGIVTKKNKSKMKNKTENSIELNHENSKSDIMTEIVNSKTIKNTLVSKKNAKKSSKLKAELKQEKKKIESISRDILNFPTTIIHKQILSIPSYNFESLKPISDFDSLSSKAHNGKSAKNSKEKKRKLSVVDEDDIESIVTIKNKKKKAKSKQTFETTNPKSEKGIPMTKQKLKERIKKKGFNTFIIEDVT